MAVLVLLGIIFLFPYIWMFLISFMEAPQIAKYPSEWIPDPWTLRSYEIGFNTTDFPSYIKNTILISLLCIVGAVLSCSLTAFGFAKFKARFKGVLFLVLMSTMMIPQTVTLIPSYAIYSKLGLVNTFVPLVLPWYFGCSAYSIFLLRQFFSSLPSELAEAAMLDGCSWLRIFYRIYLPNAKPALLVIVINTMILVWNDYLGPLIYLFDPKKFTIAIGLNIFRVQAGGVMDIGPLMAMACIAILPLLIVFIFLQRFFIEGIVTSGIKG